MIAIPMPWGYALCGELQATLFELRPDKSTPHGRQVFGDFLNTSHKSMGRDLSRFCYGVPTLFSFRPAHRIGRTYPGPPP